jgi:hypothetical protein
MPAIKGPIDNMGDEQRELGTFIVVVLIVHELLRFSLVCGLIAHVK